MRQDQLPSWIGVKLMLRPFAIQFIKEPPQAPTMSTIYNMGQVWILTTLYQVDFVQSMIPGLVERQLTEQ